MDLAIIGNCQYSALVDSHGSIPWLCWPRFDSSFVFGSLLDEKKGGKFQIGPADDSPGRQNYIFNTNVLVTQFDTPSGKFEVVDFAPRFYQYDRFFRPTSLIRILRPIEGEPIVKVQCDPSYEYGQKHLTAMLGSNHIHYSGAEQPIRLTTDASLTMVMEGRPFVLSKTHYFVLAWGRPFEAPLRSTCEEFLEQTVRYWQRWVKHCLLPADYQAQVIRSALVLKLHQFEDTGAIIAATTTSIPEARGTQRNWDYRFCWLRDAHFTVRAFQKLSHFEELETFERYLRNIVETSGKKGLQPVYGIAGETDLEEKTLDHLSGYRGHKPVRIGNQAYVQRQHDLYGEMILAISPLFMDIRFQGDNLPPHKLLVKLMAQIEEFLEGEDAGIWEFRGTAQRHTFSLLMHWAGCEEARKIAIKCKYPEIEALANKLLQHSEEAISKHCWDPNLQAFVQGVGSHHMDASLLMLINLGFLLPSDPRAIPHLDATVKSLATKGGLLHRYINKDDFGATENAFIVCCFWLAEAYALLGRKDEARTLFDKLLGFSNHLGIYSEDLDPETLEQWGNFPQTYSHVGLINAAFAISPPW